MQDNILLVALFTLVFDLLIVSIFRLTFDIITGIIEKRKANKIKILIAEEILKPQAEEKEKD